MSCSHLCPLKLTSVGPVRRTVEEVSFEGSALGLMLAGLSVVGSGMQQILVRSLQQVRRWPGYFSACK